MPTSVPEDLQDAIDACNEASAALDMVEGDEAINQACARLAAAEKLLNAVVAKYKALDLLRRVGA